MKTKKSINPALSEAGRALGSVRSEKKAAAVRENGRKGGRPPIRGTVFGPHGGQCFVQDGRAGQWTLESKTSRFSVNGGKAELIREFKRLCDPRFPSRFTLRPSAES